MPTFTHIDAQGKVRMVDVSAKKPTQRQAVAQGVVSMQPATLEMIASQAIQKGNVLETARIAGIMAAKQTASLIPMCHPLKLTHVQIDFFPDSIAGTVRIQASVRALDQTGVEMEALTAVAVAGLTLYDMCKAVDRAMIISDVCLVSKSGGKSGTYRRKT